MNFASVFGTGTVFICQNNGYAISMPVSGQTASETIAQKAVGYGMEGVLVDGNDVFAVLAATEEAVRRARTGQGPTLIEALTYRVGPHTTSDDPARYRTGDEEAAWRDLDPIERVRRYLVAEEAWDEEWEAQTLATATGEIEAAVEWAESLPAEERPEVFDAMFERLTPDLTQQRDGVE